MRISRKQGSLKELSDYKNKLIEKLLSDEEIVKALGNNETNFLNKPPKDLLDLLYVNIFPYKVIPLVTQEEAKTYITMSFRYRYLNNEFKLGRITIFVFSHVSLMKTDYSTTRTDYILDKIHGILNDSSDFGINKFRLVEMDDFMPTNQHIGSYIVYESQDFMNVNR